MDLCFDLFNHSFSRNLSQLDKDFLPCNVKLFNAPIIFRPLLLEARMFRGPKLPKTYHPLIEGASIVEKMDIMPTDALIRALALISQLHLHLPLPMEPTLFLLPPSKSMPEGESTMLLWRKPRMLRMLSLVCFSPTTPLQLCYLILGHHILLYLLYMLRNIICP
jgi:hypothetical protein